MKILYVKCNSERHKEFQLKTIIYKDNGHIFVKKKALCPEAIPHLMRMKESEKKLNETVLNTNIKIAKILSETQDSLTFEYIEGVSFETMYNKAKELGKESEVINQYTLFIQNGFKTTLFNEKTMVTNTFKELLGDNDYSKFNNQPCFKGVSNLDLILSNIIFKNDDIYIIDYEWVYDLHLPLEYILHRVLHYENKCLESMDTYFIQNTVVKDDAFFTLQTAYTKYRNTSIFSYIDEKTQHIEILNKQINNLMQKNKNLTIKGRMKTILKFIFPLKFLQKLKALKNNLNS